MVAFAGKVLSQHTSAQPSWYAAQVFACCHCYLWINFENDGWDSQTVVLCSRLLILVTKALVI